MIIVDRGYDPVAPIIHELTYQAMVNDLLEMDGDVIRYTTTNDQGQEQLKEVILGKAILKTSENTTIQKFFKKYILHFR